MDERFKNPRYWRDRAEETRAKAHQFITVSEKRRLLRIAEEYDKLGDRAAELQHNLQGLGSARMKD